MSQNEEKNPSIETDPEMTQLIELVDKRILRATYKSLKLHLICSGEQRKTRILRRNMEDTKRHTPNF